MGTNQIILVALGLVVVAVGAFLFWRYVWFFRNPDRTIPSGEVVVSPADGTVVYVKTVKPDEEVLCVKEGVSLRIRDILRQDVDQPRLLIGIFMSPFDVHYNRAPISGTVDFINHYPAVNINHHMGSMHFRTFFKKPPYYENSLHIGENERTVTRMTGRFKDEEVSYYVIQIAGGSVRGIDSYVSPGQSVARGSIFGMIRIGSQVDLVLPHRDKMKVAVQPGDRVYAGESVLVE